MTMSESKNGEKKTISAVFCSMVDRRVKGCMVYLDLARAAGGGELV